MSTQCPHSEQSRKRGPKRDPHTQPVPPALGTHALSKFIRVLARILAWLLLIVIESSVKIERTEKFSMPPTGAIPSGIFGGHRL